MNSGISLLTILIVLVAAGIVLFLANHPNAPISPLGKRIFNIVVGGFVILWLLKAFGIFNILGSVRL